MENPVKKLSIAALGLLFGATAALADVSVQQAPSSAVHGEDLQVRYDVDSQSYLAFLWVQNNQIVKVERIGFHRSGGARTATLQAPHLRGSFQLYAYAVGRRGAELGAPVTITVGDAQPTQPTQPTLQRFEVTVENTGGAGPLAPGAFALHQGNNPLFRSGSRASDGLEAMAEDGDPSVLSQELMTNQRVLQAGVFNTPTGANMPGPAMPGSSYRFVVEADSASQARLSLATMLAQTNDAFVAPKGSIALFDGQGNPLGERTFEVEAWDAGTEANQAFGMGPDQAPRQAGKNTGGAEGVLRMFSDSTRAIPTADQMVRVDVRERGSQLEAP